MKLVKFLIAIAVTLSAIAGHAKAVEFQAPKPGKPTYLLLPGVNRGTMLTDPAVQLLVADGAGIITFNFSVQPLSIAELGPRESADLRDVSLESLAEETLALAKQFEKEHGILVKDMIPVSLSFTGAVSPFLNAFPQVIDMVPLTSMAAYNPHLEAYYRMLKGAELFNPIFGPGITRASLDSAYRTQWVPQVNSIVEQFQLPSNRRSEMIEGYVALSRAVEGFSWKNSAPSKKVKRVFVIAGNEAESLQRDQVLTILDLQDQGYNVATILVEGSGHVIPSEKPAAYFKALKIVSDAKIEKGTLIVLDANKNTIRTLKGESARRSLESL